MAPQKKLLVDKDLCYGCHSCEVACKQEHSLPVRINFIRVDTDGPKIVGGRLKMDFIPIICTHCEKPSCVSSCPVDAIRKDSDGIILIERDSCNGCRECIDSCPFSVIQFDKEENVVIKCDLCISRIGEKRLPACVHHCPTGALMYGYPLSNVQNRNRGNRGKSHKILKRHWKGGFY